MMRAQAPTFLQMMEVAAERVEVEAPIMRSKDEEENDISQWLEESDPGRSLVCVYTYIHTKQTHTRALAHAHPVHTQSCVRVFANMYTHWRAELHTAAWFALTQPTPA